MRQQRSNSRAGCQDTGKRPTHACMMWGGYQGSAPYEDAAIYLVNLRNPNKERIAKVASATQQFAGRLPGYR
ncbi:MAG: hypothetical protein ACLSTL_07470 [Eubacterium sp.]